jgi:hypothetical protein
MQTKQTSELCRLSNRRWSANLVPTFTVKGVSWLGWRITTAVNLGFMDRSRYFFFQIPSQLSSLGWVHPVPDLQLFRKSDSAGIRTQIFWVCSQAGTLCTGPQKRSRYWRQLCETFLDNVRFEVFTAVTMRNGIFWDVTPCSSCKNWRFGET